MLLTNVMEQVGMGLAPLGEEQAEIAHRAMASFLRTESALGLMARMAGEQQKARRHLARALHLATLVDDVGSERKAMRRLGMLALRGISRALDLFDRCQSRQTPFQLAAIASSLADPTSWRRSTSLKRALLETGRNWPSNSLTKPWNVQ